MAGLNETPSGERLHVGFFGVRNAGKSSLVNAVTGQDLAVVSDVAGTTTDPVRKAMELLPVGPVLIIDTPGLDDEGELGELRVKKALRALDSTDVAVLVVDASKGMGVVDEKLVETFRKRNVPYVIAWNKADLIPEGAVTETPACTDEEGCRFANVATSSTRGTGVNALKETIAALGDRALVKKRLVSDLVGFGDVVVLVVPIDSAAPKGRIILPQQQVIRDCIESGALACVASVEGLPSMFKSLAEPPKLVVTDSQAFGEVAAIVPDEMPLTSFSILMARYKGTLKTQIQAVDVLDNLTDEDVVLISEGCTHHRQCEDIGTVKLPALIRHLSGANPKFEFTAGREFPSDLGAFSVVVHCGGCMLNDREMQHRAEICAAQSVPFTNYGMTIAKAKGILERSLSPIPER
ncbi:MAG: [Eggerthellaceae bacterium]|nr:[FeFe] hydrogenase H-cluster maturation GTPase HydF [Eggerthellaceae bacterium]